MRKDCTIMEIRVLKYFLEVVREGNMTAAAAVLHVSQPTLSRQIMELEEELGQTLMIRGNRHITLTDEGVLFRKRAEEIISLVEKTQAEMSSSNESISGEIYIGAAETKGIKFIADVANQLKDEGYNIRYHISSGDESDVTEKLDKGLIDFGLLIGTSKAQKYNFMRLPIYDEWGVYMRKDSPLAVKSEISLNDLTSLPLIMSRQALDNNEFSGHFGIDIEKLNIVATSNLLYNASVMVERGFGYAVSLDGIINTTGDSNLCFVPIRPQIIAHMDFIWKRYQVFSKPAELFLNRVQKLFGKDENRVDGGH